MYFSTLFRCRILFCGMICIAFSTYSQTNVSCQPQWAKESNSVCQITINGFTCTGVLLNNENNDRKPYVLTARHCLTTSNLDANLSPTEIANAENAIFQFRDRTTDCNGNQMDNVIQYQGAIFRAANFYTDFALLEISPNNLPLNPDLNYAGWSRNDPSSGTLTNIGHPNGDPQQILFGSKTVPLDPWKYHINWNSGSTSTGSSGGPLFSSLGKVIGSLSYGENFGRFDYMWSSSSDPAKQLKTWLSPTNNLSEMDALVPVSFNNNSINLCYGTNNTVNLPYLLPGENVTWSTSGGISVVNSGGNFINVTASNPNTSGLGSVTATWGNTQITKNIYYGKPDLNAITYDFQQYAVNDLNIVSANTNHTITLWPIRLSNYTTPVSWNPSPVLGSPYGTEQFDFSLSPGQSMFLNPLSITNSCGTSNRTVEFWASWSLLYYPNPATDQLSVEFSRVDKLETLPEKILLLSEKSTIPIKTYILSEVKKNNEFNGNKLEINVKDLPRGTYYLHAVSGEGAREKTEKKRIILR